MSETPLHYEDGLAIARRIHSGELTSVEVTELMLGRISDTNDELGAFLQTTEELAIRQARAADKEISEGKVRSPLHGVPIAVKDLLDTAGIVTTYGMPLNNSNVPTKDATVVKKLAEAGTVLLGKLKLTEGAYARHHPDVSPPVNPWDKDCWVGVSSSGSGVATAAGLCFATIGSDTGGSIRFPSAANGIVGLKPTWGRVSRAGVFPLAYSLDHIGPMTRSVADAAAMLEIIAGHDDEDPTSSSRVVPAYLDALDEEISRLRIGVDLDYVKGNTHSELVDAVNEVSACLGTLNCEIVEIKVPFESICSGWPVTAAVEALHAHRQTYPEQKEKYGHISDLLELGQSIDAATYMEFEMERRAFKASLQQIFSTVDIILCPSMPLYAPPKEGSVEMDEAEQSLADTLKFTAPYDYSGNPTLSLPWRPGSRKLPLGIQLVGRNFEEGLLLRLGRNIERHATQGMHPL